jgi:hypothetical protein
MLERYAGVSFAPKGYKAMLEIGTLSYYALPYGPVTAVTEVKEVGQFSEDTALTSGEGYQVKNGRILFRAPGVYEVSYTAGYDPLPPGIREDILRLVAWIYQNRGIRFEAQEEVTNYPDWQVLAANRYMAVVL